MIDTSSQYNHSPNSSSLISPPSRRQPHPTASTRVEESTVPSTRESLIMLNELKESLSNQLNSLNKEIGSRYERFNNIISSPIKSRKKKGKDALNNLSNPHINTEDETRVTAAMYSDGILGTPPRPTTTTTTSSINNTHVYSSNVGSSGKLVPTNIL